MQRAHYLQSKHAILPMTEPVLHHVACVDPKGGHRMAYWQWGNARSAHVVLCVHGLTRQGRDFDALAQFLVERAGGNLRVVCPDVVGRGQSDWLKDPNGYQLPQYAADMLALAAQLHAESPVEVLDYVGTSMGGLIGIALAGSKDVPLPVPIRHLVINDVGPTLDLAGLQRIGKYVGTSGRFATLQEAADAMWGLSSSFGPHTPEQWLALSRPMLKPDGNGFKLHYDPAIALPFKAITPEMAAAGEAFTWAAYDAVRCPTLVLRGAESDLLSHATAEAMTQRGPKARLVEFAGVGHAPTFVDPTQSAVVTGFLLD